MEREEEMESGIRRWTIDQGLVLMDLGWGSWKRTPGWYILVSIYRSQISPHPKAHLFRMRLPSSQDPSMYVFSIHSSLPANRFGNIHDILLPPIIDTARMNQNYKQQYEYMLIYHWIDNWGEKAKRRKTTGTGRMRHMKEVPRRFKNGFQTGVPKGARGPATKSE